MTLFGVDYAWGRPSVTSLKNAGVKFVCRYLSYDTTGKNLGLAEAVRLSDAGIWIVVVWETTAKRALAGHTIGAEDARAAAAQAKACGMPADRPIYFAVDFDASSGQQAAINAYLDGAASVLGKNRTGIYGGYNPVKRALDGGHCAWAWQTYAWSSGHLDSRSHLFQYSNDHKIGGVGLDFDHALKDDYGQWKVGVSPHAAPTPPLVEDDMPYGIVETGTDPKTCLTTGALPKGRYKTIGLNCDNGLQGLLPASLRVAFAWTDDKGVSHWDVHDNVIVDSAKGQTVLPLPAGCTGFSVVHEDVVAVKDPAKVDVHGEVTVAYEVS
jgi:hypothetical protein